MENGEELSIDTMVYKTSEIERITEIAVKAASWAKRFAQWTRPMFGTSVLWRKVVSDCVKRLDPSIELSHMYADNAAMQ